MQFLLNSLHFMSHHFFIKQNIKIFFMPVFLATCLLNPFAFLISLPSTSINDYIFYFNPTNSLIIFPLNSPYILPITFLLAGSKNFVSCG